MLQPPLTKKERDDLLKLAADKLAERAKHRASDPDLALQLRQEATAAKEEYFDRLPVLVMSCCPYCEQPFLRSFDPFGLDGTWWESDRRRPGPPPCPHFCVLRGAVRFDDRPVLGPKTEAHTGPEVPYVIPRILDVDTMVAVLGELDVQPGHDVFTIAYFADVRPPVQELTADWPEKTFNYTTALGEPGFVIPVDPWDFELRPWIEKGKLRWCEPGSGNEKLAPADAGADACPYLDLPGRRERLVVSGPHVLGRGLPDGEPIGPAD